MSQEFPQKTSELRDPSAESREAFLNRPSLKKLNLTLGMIFQYIDEYKIKEQLEEGEIADMKRSIEYAIKNPQPGIASPRPGALREFRQQTLVSLYAPSTLSNILTQQAEAEHRPLTPDEGSALADYTQFYDIFTNHPKLRVRMLEKMIYTDPGHVSDGSQDAFGRFLYEFYGTEEKNEGQDEFFLSLEGQADLLEAWNTIGDWGFTKDDFMNGRKQIPAIRERANQFADQPFVACAITPRLRKRAGGDRIMVVRNNEVQRTFDALMNVASSLRDSFRIRVRFSEEDEIQLVPGRPYQPGIDVGLVNFRRMLGSDVVGYSRENVSDFRGLSAFALSPLWGKFMRENYVWNIALNGFDVRHPYVEEDGEFTILVRHFSSRSGDECLASGLNHITGEPDERPIHGTSIAQDLD